MSEHYPESPMAASLRERAEKFFRERPGASPENLDALSPESLHVTLHELRVHQIELEMQNEELQRAQKDLHASRTRYFDLYDLAPVGYCSVSERGLILEANLAATTLLGVIRAGLVKQPISRFIHREDHDSYYKMQKQLMETRKPQACELRMVRPEGVAIWTLLTSSVTQNEGGEPVCRFVFNDISESKRKDEALRESENLLTQAQNVAGLGTYTLDITTGFWKSSAIMDRVFGIGESYERTVEGWANLVHPDDRAMMVGYFKNEVLGLRRPFDKEYRIIRQDDQAVRWMHGRGMLESDNSNRLTKMLGTIQDITERKKGEALQANERTLLRTLVDHLPVALYLKDSAGRKTLANPLDLRNCGATDEAAVIGRTDFDFFPREQATAFHADDKRVIDTGQPVINREEMLTRPDGTTVWNLTSKVPLTDSAGHVVGLAGIGLDITEIRKAEESLRELNRHLEIEKTLAEAANRTKSEFLGVMSHELRTPLNGVLGFAELLADTALDSEQEAYVRTISSSGEHLLAIVNDVLDFSSIDAGALAIHVAPLAVADLVKSAEDTVRKTADEKGLELRCELAPDVPEQITSDEQRIRQILINLLGNAVKFTPGGSVVLRVATASDGGRRSLDFCVEDTGIGISPETLDRLFQPFVQADAKINRRFGGTGLGLAITKRLVEAIGGSITVASTPGKGSTFTFRFPLESATVHVGGMASMPSHVSDREGNKSALTEHRPPVQTGETCLPCTAASDLA